MMKDSARPLLFVVAMVVATLFSPPGGWGLIIRYMRPDLEQIPIDQLIQNIQASVSDNPNDSTLLMNLGRVHAMAFARGTQVMELNKSRDPNQPNTTNPWFGYEPDHLPFVDTSTNHPAADDEAAREHLAKAIQLFQQVVELDKDNLTARLSLAWCQEQDGRKMESLEGYRNVIAMGWEKEKEMTASGPAFRSIVAEAALYLKPRLDPESDRDELADIEKKLQRVAKIARPVTPIAIPLGNRFDLSALIDNRAFVPFDADGSGYEKHWTWIQPDCGWLVYDQRNDGAIRSGLQLFGNVTFWCFWNDGYQAMRSLDANGDRELSGNELRNLAIWIDRNSNGISEAGEVCNPGMLGIVAISCRASEYVPTRQGAGDTTANCRVWNPAGVRFSDGRTRPTYDVILHPADR